MDELVTQLALWLNGARLTDTVYTCLYLHHDVIDAVATADPVLS